MRMSCPCGSEQPYEACCGLYIGTGAPVPTAEALMRSRYSAYVKGEVQHVIDTLAPELRDDQDPASTEAWSKNSTWKGLEILGTEGGGEGDTDGVVEFLAKYEVQDQLYEHHETATFRHQDGTWYYVDGQIHGAEPYRREQPKIGRNEPCPCGSGKKYKQCCLRRAS